MNSPLPHYSGSAGWYTLWFIEDHRPLISFKCRMASAGGGGDCPLDDNSIPFQGEIRFWCCCCCSLCLIWKHLLCCSIVCPNGKPATVVDWVARSFDFSSSVHLGVRRTRNPPPTTTILLPMIRWYWNRIEIIWGDYFCGTSNSSSFLSLLRLLLHSQFKIFVAHRQLSTLNNALFLSLLSLFGISQALTAIAVDTEWSMWTLTNSIVEHFGFSSKTICKFFQEFYLLWPISSILASKIFTLFKVNRFR